MKKLTHEMRYDGATPGQVHAMLAETRFREQVCEYQHFPRHTVTIEPNGQRMRVRVDQRRPADGLPSFARKFVGQEINIVQEEEWSSATDATLSVAIPGKPGEMTGTVRLAGDDTGTTETVDAEVRVNIPVVGGRIEGFIADMLLKALKAESRVGRDWLATGGRGPDA
ncbi:MAG: DUF2505 domain-containing protein [Marmoricola sp.]